jgi:hypothetical protein
MLKMRSCGGGQKMENSQLKVHTWSSSRTVQRKLTSPRYGRRKQSLNVRSLPRYYYTGKS